MVAIFVEKAMLDKGQKKLMTVLGVFKFDSMLVLSLASAKRREVGGGGSTPPKDERRTVM